MTNVQLLTGDDASALSGLVAGQLRADARLNPFVCGDTDEPHLRDALASTPGVWIARREGRLTGHLHGALLESDTYGHGAWVSPDGASFEDADTLADLYARAGQTWIDAGALEHYAWVLDHPERTSPWMELGFARMHQRGVRPLDDAPPRQPPEGYTLRVGGVGDLETALDLGREIDRVQAHGPSFSLNVGGDERAEIEETLAEPDVRYFLAEYAGFPVAQCTTFPLPTRRGSFPHTLHLSAVAVREEHRGRGVGSALVDGALARARQHGFRYVETNWRVTNRGAAHYWTSHGFHPTYVRLHRTVGTH